MKRVIQRCFNLLGYQVCRVRPTSISPAFSDMKQLCEGVGRPVVLDVGAYHGTISKTFRRILPQAAIYAFEPFPESFEWLRSNIKSDPDIRAFNYGMSSSDGERRFHSNVNAATNSLLETHELGATTWGRGVTTTATVRVQMKTLDSVVQSLGVTQIDILKLDVQGAETQVLAGAESTLSSGAVRMIYSEIITQPTYKGQVRFDAALAAFYDRGFDLFNIYNLSNTKQGQLRQVDAIFTRRQ